MGLAGESSRAALPSIGVEEADREGGVQPEGGAVGGWMACLTLNWVGLLATVGVRVTGHSGCYCILVADFLYI